MADKKLGGPTNCGLLFGALWANQLFFALDELVAAVTGNEPVVAGGGAGGNGKGTDDVA